MVLGGVSDRLCKLLDFVRQMQAARFPMLDDPICQQARDELAQSTLYLNNFKGFEEASTLKRVQVTQSVAQLVS